LTFKRAHTLRRSLTLPEVILWQELRRSRFKSLRFRRQHPIGPYILDFFCSSARLAVEIDGSSHESESQYRHDERRTRWLKSRKITVLRVASGYLLARALSKSSSSAGVMVNGILFSDFTPSTLVLLTAFFFAITFPLSLVLCLPHKQHNTTCMCACKHPQIWRLTDNLLRSYRREGYSPPLSVRQTNAALWPRAAQSIQ